MLCIVIGGLWFLRSMHLIPETNTIFSIAFIAVGIAIFCLEGFNKSSVVSAPMFIYCGIAIFVCTELYFRKSAAIGLGIFLLGVMMLIAGMDMIPERKNKKAAHIPPQ